MYTEEPMIKKSIPKMAKLPPKPINPYRDGVSVPNFMFRTNRNTQNTQNTQRNSSEPTLHRPRRYNKRYKSFKKNVYCSNCNGRGHLFKECKKPIKSYGIIAFRKSPTNKELQVCLIRRKNTISYEAFIRGKYRPDELPIHLERMTTMEKKKIKQSEWTELYNEICYHRSSKHAQRERKKAKDLYDSINAGVLFDDISSDWTIPEWEFPKGRKYFNETQEECALREFREETNIRETHVRLLGETWFETFEGTNKRTYQNQYFLAIISPDANDPYIDLNSKNQITEIGDVDWFSKKESLRLIREYHTDKKRILKDGFELIRTRL